MGPLIHAPHLHGLAEGCGTRAGDIDAAAIIKLAVMHNNPCVINCL